MNEILEVNSEQLLAEIYKSISCELNSSDWKEVSSITAVISGNKPILLIPLPGVVLESLSSEQDNDRLFTSEEGKILNLKNSSKLVMNGASLESAVGMYIFNSMTGRFPVLLIPKLVGERVDVYVVEKPREFKIIPLTKETVDNIFGTKPIDRYNPPGYLKTGNTDSEPREKIKIFLDEPKKLPKK